MGCWAIITDHPLATDSSIAKTAYDDRNAECRDCYESSTSGSTHYADYGSVVLDVLNEAFLNNKPFS